MINGTQEQLWNVGNTIKTAQKRLKNVQISNLGHVYHKHVGSVANAPKR